MKKVLYFDCETSGTDPKKNAIIQLAGMIEIDGEVKESFNFKIKPFPTDEIESAALAVNKITQQEMEGYPDPKEAYRQIVALFGKYVDKFDKTDKFIVCGYNVRFDIDFLKEFFEKNGDSYLFSWLGPQKDPLPVFSYLRAIGAIDSPDAKLGTICKVLKIELDAHDALEDIVATKKVIERLDEILAGVKF